MLVTRSVAHSNDWLYWTFTGSYFICFRGMYACLSSTRCYYIYNTAFSSLSVHGHAAEVTAVVLGALRATFSREGDCKFPWEGQKDEKQQLSMSGCHNHAIYRIATVTITILWKS